MNQAATPPLDELSAKFHREKEDYMAKIKRSVGRQASRAAQRQLENDRLLKCCVFDSTPEYLLFKIGTQNSDNLTLCLLEYKYHSVILIIMKEPCYLTSKILELF